MKFFATRAIPILLVVTLVAGLTGCNLLRSATDEYNELIALGRDTGSIRWVTKLPRFDGDDPVNLVGPILAGGRLFVFGTDGRVVEASPETGKITAEWDAGDSVLISPVIAGGVMYVLAEDGTLTAYK